MPAFVQGRDTVRTANAQPQLAPQTGIGMQGHTVALVRPETVIPSQSKKNLLLKVCAVIGSFALVALAGVYVRQKWNDDAQMEIARASVAANNDKAQMAIVQGSVDANNYEQAINAVALISDNQMRDKAYNFISRGSVIDDKCQQAFEVASLISDNQIRDEALSLIIGDCSYNHQEAAAQIQNKRLKAERQFGIFNTMISQGDCAEAEEYQRKNLFKIFNPDKKISSLAKLPFDDLVRKLRGDQAEKELLEKCYSKIPEMQREFEVENNRAITWYLSDNRFDDAFTCALRYPVTSKKRADALYQIARDSKGEVREKAIDVLRTNFVVLHDEFLFDQIEKSLKHPDLETVKLAKKILNNDLKIEKLCLIFSKSKDQKLRQEVLNELDEPLKPFAQAMLDGKLPNIDLTYAREPTTLPILKALMDKKFVEAFELGAGSYPNSRYLYNQWIQDCNLSDQDQEALIANLKNDQQRYDYIMSVLPKKKYEFAFRVLEQMINLKSSVMNEMRKYWYHLPPDIKEKLADMIGGSVEIYEEIAQQYRLQGNHTAAEAVRKKVPGIAKAFKQQMNTVKSIVDDTVDTVNHIAKRLNL